MFSEKHDEQLRDLFGGVYAGRMGLKSWMGPMLEHAQSAALHPIDRSRDYMPVAPESHEARRASVEIGEDAIRAVREERIVRGALGRMDAEAVRSLRLAYTPQPRGAMSALVAHLLGGQRALELHAARNSPNREVRRDARKALAGGERWAAQVLEVSKEAYAASEAQERAAASAERGRRLARLMEAAA